MVRRYRPLAMRMGSDGHRESALVTLAGPAAELFYRLCAEDRDPGEDLFVLAERLPILLEAQESMREIDDAVRWFDAADMFYEIADLTLSWWTAIAAIATQMLASSRAVTGREALDLLGLPSVAAAKAWLRDETSAIARIDSLQ